jgi:hypothetical protein
LDDLIVGALDATPSGKANAGKSYLPVLNLPLEPAKGAPTIKSSKPSPLTSPAVETDQLLKSFVFSPLIIKPLLVLHMSPQMVKKMQVGLMSSLVKPTTQQSTYLLLAQEALSLMARMRMMRHKTYLHLFYRLGRHKKRQQSNHLSHRR